MFRTLLLLILSASFATPALWAQTRRKPAPAPVLRNPTGDKALVELEKQILEAIRERNTGKLDGILAPDFVYVSPRKRDLHKQEFLNHVRSFPMEIEWLSAEEMKIHIYGDIAVVTGIQNAKVRSEKTGVQSGDKAFTDVFRRRQGEWQLVLAFTADIAGASVQK